MNSALPDELNEQYWLQSDVQQVLSGIQQPGDELEIYLKKGVRVLDFGCGRGDLAAYILNKEAAYTGADIHKGALDFLQTRYPVAGTVLLKSGEPLSFSSDSFDVVLVSFVLVSIISDEMVHQTVKELIRVVKTGGVIWVTEAGPSPDYQSEYIDGEQLLGKKMIAVSYNERKEIKRFIRHYSSEELETLFAPLKVISKRVVVHPSPSSGKNVHTNICVFKK